MAQSRRTPDKPRVLFFSRGRGCGHAIPDMAIADELAKLRSDIDLRFVSYGTGAETLAAHGRPVIDLGMPDANPLWDTVVGAGQVIGELEPVLVISHEEFAALPLARIFGVPTAFITEWFADPGDPRMQALAYADEVIVIEEGGIFDEPPCVEGRVHYTGPVLRKFSYCRKDRERARRELGIDQDATVVLVMPGGWATEGREPIFDLVVPAFNTLRACGRLLVWMAGEDYALLGERFEGRNDVIVKERDWQIDRWMVACDLAITKGNRITLKELAALGVPSISISHGRNPVDDILIERIPTNVTLDVRTATPKTLAAAMLEILREGSCGPGGLEIPNNNGALLAAQRLAQIVDNVTAAKGDWFRLITARRRVTTSVQHFLNSRQVIQIGKRNHQSHNGTFVRCCTSMIMSPFLLDRNVP